MALTGSFTLQSCNLATNYFMNNPYPGGGLVVSGTSGSVTISSNIFSGNSAQSSIGGGICIQNNGETIALLGNLFVGNSCRGNGGGAYIVGSATLSGNVFTGNSANSTGGIFLGGSGMFVGNTFTGNSANMDTITVTLSAGAVYCSGSATLTGNYFSGKFCQRRWLRSRRSCLLCRYSNCSRKHFYWKFCQRRQSRRRHIICGSSATLTGNTFTGNLGSLGGGAYCSGTMMLRVPTHSPLTRQGLAAGFMPVDQP